MAYYARFSKFLRLHRPFPAIVCACVHILAGVCVHVPQLYRHRTHILRMISRFCCGIATRDNSRHGRLNIVQRSSRDMRALWCGEHLATYAHQTRGARLCETCAKHVQRKGRAECAGENSQGARAKRAVPVTTVRAHNTSQNAHTRASYGGEWSMQTYEICQI